MKNNSAADHQDRRQDQRLDVPLPVPARVLDTGTARPIKNPGRKHSALTPRKNRNGR